MVFGKIKKTKIAFFIVLFLILISMGIFLWINKEDFFGTNPGYEKEFVGDYLIKNTSEGEIIENKEGGLIVRVPKSWVVKQYGFELNLFSPEVEFDDEGVFILNSFKEQGACAVNIQIIKSETRGSNIETDSERLIKLIKKVRKNPIKDETKIQEVVNINGKIALKETRFFDNRRKFYVLLEIPVDNLVYSFSTGVIYSEKCILEFNKVLETVKISD